ncbi:transcriptional regulator [Haloimpatiens sp. FM7315]|uniref:transcriptional regulator n=1 Tax=Haloimpatiens sp. FM7315 TaxID=3298609 RepID=UPI0035A36599
MEILSKGEKIKRARVYKGLTLKDVCSDRISVSKLSCIENDKVEPESDVLEYISEKLDLDLDYLRLGISEHLEENYDLLKDYKDKKDYKDSLEYNLKVAKNYGDYGIAVKFMHLMFTYYLRNNDIREIPFIIGDYYDICQKVYTEENRIVYYCDMSRYCFRNKEFNQAINFCSNIRKFFLNKENLNNHYLIIATYNEIACYLSLKDYDRALHILTDLEKVVDYEENVERKAKMYEVMAIICLRKNREKFKSYEEKSYELYGEDWEGKANAIYNYAFTMFQIGTKDQGVEYLERALKLYPKHNRINLVDFMLSVTEVLVSCDVLELSKTICNKALDCAIEVDKIEYIEKAYYYKAKIYFKFKLYSEAEIYMNLCLDALVKFGNSEELHERYLEMGSMYYEMNNLKDSLKYFNLAIKLEKKL